MRLSRRPVGEEDVEGCSGVGVWRGVEEGEEEVEDEVRGKGWQQKKGEKGREGKRERRLLT